MTSLLHLLLCCCILLFKLINVINAEVVTYKEGNCMITKINKKECGFLGWGDYYEYEMIPDDCDGGYGPLDESKCIYDDSNGHTDCEAYGDYKKDDRRKCWIKYVDDKCVKCNCDDCTDTSAGRCYFYGGCRDNIILAGSYSAGIFSSEQNLNGHHNKPILNNNNALTEVSIIVLDAVINGVLLITIISILFMIRYCYQTINIPTKKGYDLSDVDDDHDL